MRVFLSSTFTDLRQFRDRIQNALRKYGSDLAAMECFGARAEAPLDVSLQEVRTADLVILVVAGRYGTIDTDSGISITHLEFREAIRSDIPVLAFVIDEPEIRPEHDTERIADFVREIERSGRALLDHVATLEELPESVVAATARYVEGHGRPNRRFRVFAPFDSFFATTLDPAAAFNHCVPMFGRRSEFDSLQTFLTSQHRICVLTGSGGVGKSKLLYEFAHWRTQESNPDLPEIRFYRSGATLTAEAFQDLPGRPVCLVIEDAHRIDRLDDFLQTCRTHPSVTKLILSIRPGFDGAVNNALRSMSADSISRLELLPLQRDTIAIELATACLGDTRKSLAKPLVAASDGNPLVITVGAHQLRTRAIDAQLLERKNEFISAALTNLVAAVPDPIADNVPRDLLLSTLAAIQPFDPADEETRIKLAHRLKAHSSDVVRAIDALDAHYVILRRGANARITPDVLADHLLFVAALTKSGESTGFLDELVDQFGESHLKNVLFNGAELDWRSKLAGNATSVLERIWQRISASLADRTFRRRRSLLASLLRPAYYAPLKALEIAEWCIATTTAPHDADPLAEFVKVDHEDVVQAACEVLAIVGRSSLLTERCVATLWKLAKADTRNPNPWPAHPFRILKDLAAYSTDNDLETIIGVIRELHRIVDSNEHLNSTNPLCDVITESLEREVQFQRADRKSITLGSRPLVVDRVRVQRNLAISLLSKLALGNELSSAAQAVAALAELLRMPQFNFGRATTDADIDAFRPEAEEALNTLKSISQSSRHTIIRYLARRALFECDESRSCGLGSQLCAVQNQLEAFPEERLIDALMRNAPASHFSGDWNQWDSAARANCMAAATALWNRLTTAEAVVAELAPLCEQLESANIRFDWGMFLFALASSAGGRLKDLAAQIVAAKSPVMRQAAPAVLRVLRNQGRIADFEELAKTLATSNDPKTKRFFAANLPYCLHGDPEPGEAELRLFRSLADDPDFEVRGAALSALARFRMTATSDAIELLVGADFDANSELANKALECLEPKYGIDPSRLSNTDIDALLSKLRRVETIDDHHHEMSEFLEYAATRRPAEVVRMLLARIDDSTQPGKSFSEGYQPIPFLENHLRLGKIEDRQERLSALREVREHALKSSWQHSEWVPKLFRDLVVDVNDAIEVVMEWGRESEAGKVVAAARLLREMPETILERFHTDFAEMLENASNLGRPCHESVENALAMLAHPKGARWVPSPGTPDPFFVAQAKMADDLAVKYADRPAVGGFFQKLAAFARQSMLSRDEGDEDEE